VFDRVASTIDTVNATLYDKLNFSFIRDMAPVANIARTPLVVSNRGRPRKNTITAWLDQRYSRVDTTHAD